jgi:hypothetical protein
VLHNVDLEKKRKENLLLTFFFSLLFFFSSFYGKLLQIRQSCVMSSFGHHFFIQQKILGKMLGAL